MLKNFILLTFLFFSLQTSASDPIHLPDSLVKKLDAADARGKVSVWNQWFYETGFDVYHRYHALDSACAYAEKVLPRDSALYFCEKFHFDLSFRMTDPYAIERNLMFEKRKTLLDTLIKINPDFKRSKASWFIDFSELMEVDGDFDLAEEHILQGIQLCKEENFSNLLAIAYVIYGQILIEKDQNEKAILIFEDCKKIVEDSTQRVTFDTEFFFARTYAFELYNIRRYEASKAILEPYLPIISTLPKANVHHGLYFRQEYAITLSTLGEYEEAQKHIDTVKQQKNDRSIYPSDIPFLVDYSHFLMRIGKLDLYKEYEKKYRQLKWQRYNQAVIAESNGWIRKLESENKTDQIQALKIEEERIQQNFKIRIYLLLGLLSLILSLFLYQFLKKRNRDKLIGLEIQNQQKVIENRDRLFSSITHDIRTPLSLMIGPLERAIQTTEKSNPKSSTDLTIAREKGIELMNIFTQILDWNKAESNSLKLNPQVGKLNLAIDALQSKCKKRVFDNGLMFKDSIEISSSYFQVDYDKLEKMVIYSTNSLLKSCEVGDDFQLNIQSVDNAKLNVIIRAIKKDATSNKSNELQSTEQNYKINNSIEIQLAKKIAEIMNADFTIETKNNNSTSISISAPIKFTTQAEEDAEQEAMAAPVSNPDQKTNILIVEDEPELLNFLESSLQGEFHIEKANSTSIAFTIAQSTLPDLIISDWNLPDNNGGWLCKQIKKNPLTAHIPFMVLTANNNDDNRRETLETGAIAWMSKPFSMVSLKKQIQTILLQQSKFKEYWQSKNQDFDSGGNDNLVENDMSQIPTDPLLEKVLEAIKTNFSQATFSVEELAKAVGINRVQLNRKTNKLTGDSPSALIRKYRLQQAKKLLTNEQLTIAEISYEVGFKNPNNFATAYKKHFNVSPSEERNNQSR